MNDNLSSTSKHHAPDGGLPSDPSTVALAKGEAAISKPFTDTDVRKYVNIHGIGDPEAVSKIQKEFEQGSLPGFQVPYKEKYPAQQGRVSAERFRAETLKNLESPQRLTEAFKGGDVISSILPDYIKGAIPSFDIVGARIESPEDFAKLTWTLRTPYMEVLKAAFLNRNGKVAHSATLSVGTINQTLIHPQMILRQLQRLVGKIKTNRVIISHNHPSGQPSPSHDDIRTTQVLEQSLKVAGIELLDHVITNGRNFASWKGGWAVQALHTPQPEWEVVSRSDLSKINDPGDLGKIIASLRQADPDHDHVIYGDSKLQVTAVERLPVSLSVDDLALRIARGSGREGAINVWFESVRRDVKDIGLLGTTLKRIEVTLLDAGTSSHRSLKACGLMEEVSKTWGQDGREHGAEGAGITPTSSPSVFDSLRRLKGKSTPGEAGVEMDW